MAEKLRLPIIDIFQIMLSQAEPDKLLRPDGLHFTEKAYQLLAEQIVKATEKFSENLI